MDTITHGIVGALAGKAFFAGRDVAAGSGEDKERRAESAPQAQAAIVACTLGSIFPDIDVFAGPIARNPLAIMEWHRNITHSLVMLPVWAFLLAGVSLPLAKWVRWKRPSFLELAGIYAFGLGTHVFLDVATNFGTMVWSPLNYSRPAWDWLFIVDLTFTALALVPQLAAWSYREPGKFGRRAGVCWVALTGGVFGAYALADTAGYPFPRWVIGAASATLAVVIFMPATRGMGFRWKRAAWCRAGVAMLCVYLYLAATAHGRALGYVEDYAAAHHLQVETLAALPLPPTLTHWTGVISTPQGVWRTTFHLPGGKPESNVFYADAQSEPAIEEAKKLHDVQVYLWFARFPVWQVEQRAGQTVVEITDVRFFREEVDELQKPRRLANVRNNAAGFTFEVVFDAQGDVISQGFTQPDR